jgi:hypothetical protein
MDNPSARALYMFDADTLFRIHDANEPNTIGRAAWPRCCKSTGYGRRAPAVK